MARTALIAGVAALTLSTTIAAAHSHRPAPMVRGMAHAFVSGKGITLYDQTSAVGSSGIDSQNFESTYAAYDDEAADDFTVPAGQTWKVTEADVPGLYFNGSGPAPTVNVAFHAINTKGTGCTNGPGKGDSCVGKVIAEIDNITPVDTAGSFVIQWGDPHESKAVKLKGGAKGKGYFFTVTANCAFSSCGQWGWSTSTVLHGLPAMWQNPGGGFGVCPEWGKITDCISGDLDPDLSFTLRGKSSK